MRLDRFMRNDARASARTLPREPGRPLRASARHAAAGAGGDELLAMIGHELRNPLGAIAAAAQVLQAPGLDARSAAEARSVLERQTRLLGNTMDALQDLHRAKSGRLTIERHPQELATLVREACGALAAEEDVGEGAIQFDLEPAWVEGDAARLRQAVRCLVADALRVCAGRHPLSVSLRSTPAGAMLRVRPCAAATLPAAAPAPRQPGVGALLALRLFEMHEAHLQPDAGGLLVRLRAAAAPGHAPAHARAVPGQRILLIGNDAHSLDGASAQLAMDGHLVSSASGGAEGLAQLLKSNPPVCVVDLAAGGLTGFEVARRARACGYAGRMIAMAGGNPVDVDRAARAAGFDVCLPLSAEPAQLRGALRES